MRKRDKTGSSSVIQRYINLFSTTVADTILVIDRRDAAGLNNWSTNLHAPNVWLTSHSATLAL